MPDLTRRAVMRVALAAPVLATAETGLPSLQDAASRAGLRFGSDSDVAFADAPPAYRALFAGQCSLFAPNLSWARVAPTPDGPDPQTADPNIAFARGHGMLLAGAHLLWYLRTPDWFTRLDDGAAAMEAVERHIASIAGHFAGQVYAWNVVNEEIDVRTGDENGFRRSILASKLGPGWIPAAFRAARAADPHALLIYNDSGFEMDAPAQASRRDAMLRMLDHIQRDAPIDGVGLQSHLRLDGTRFDPSLYSRFLNDIARRGLKILLTEFDILDFLSGPVATRDHDIAALYSEFFSVALAETAVKAVVLWGLSDRYTWLTPSAGPNYVRPDRLPARPLPFDAEFQPKPAFHALLTAFRTAPTRSPG